jgi:hypothetical protein
MRGHATRWSAAVSILAIAVAAGMGLTLGGCAKPLFPSAADRTQFDQYDRVRGTLVEAETVDQYGRRRPALRERLRPR